MKGPKQTQRMSQFRADSRISEDSKSEKSDSKKFLKMIFGSFPLRLEIFSFKKSVFLLFWEA